LEDKEMSKMTATLRKALSVLLMVTVGSSYGLMTSTAFAQVSPKLAGQLSVRGQVTLNGINVLSGATVFGGGQIKTGVNSSAIISLGKMGQVDLEPESELTLRIESGILGGHLRSGRATISAPTGIAVHLATADGVAVADGKQAAVLTVDVTSGNTRVASVRSEAKVTFGNQIEVVAAGQEVSVGTQINKKGDPCECFDSNGKKIGDGKFNDKGVCECKDRTAGAVVVPSGGLTLGTTLVLVGLGVGGALAGIISAVAGDTNVQGVVLSPRII
jgi:hypothetical protein